MSKKQSPPAVKVVLIGESGVGKTCIISRYIKNIFDPSAVSTLGASYVSKILSFPEYNDQEVQLDIWDTAGQEKYRSLAHVLYKNAKVIIFVFDITSKKSYDAMTNFWYKTVSENILSPPIYAVAANKSDLYENEQVDEKTAKEFAQKIGAIFKLTSALNSSGIDQLFDYIGKKLIDNTFDYTKDNKDNTTEIKSVSIASDLIQPQKSAGVSLTPSAPKQKKKGCC